METRQYSDYLMQECLAIITEEVGFSGDSFDWSGDIPKPLRDELRKRGIVPQSTFIKGWTKDPDFTGNPDDIPFKVYQAMDAYNGGRTDKLTKEELDVWGSDSFKLGNHKLGEDTIIFNMTSGHDCPCRDKCDVRGNCYAVADEKLWKTPLDYRRRQNIFWDNTTIDEFIAAIPIPNYFRFSESGDFRTQVDVDRMTAVAKAISKRGIVTYGYTNRPDLDLTALMEVAVVNGHGFMANNATVIKEGDLSKYKFVCPGNCRTCDWCKVATEKTIIFPKRRR